MTGKEPKKTGGEVEARRGGDMGTVPLSKMGTVPLSPYYTPPVDVYETDDAIIVEADMPGVERSGLEVKIDNGLLTMLGRVERKPVEGVTQLYEEIAPGDYYRAFTLGEAIDEAHISAVITNGVLIVTLPKQEVKRARRIDVK